MHNIRNLFISLWFHAVVLISTLRKTRLISSNKVFEMHQVFETVSRLRFLPILSRNFRFSSANSFLTFSLLFHCASWNPTCRTCFATFLFQLSYSLHTFSTVSLLAYWTVPRMLVSERSNLPVFRPRFPESISATDQHKQHSEISVVRF